MIISFVRVRFTLSIDYGYLRLQASLMFLWILFQSFYFSIELLEVFNINMFGFKIRNLLLLTVCK